MRAYFVRTASRKILYSAGGAELIYRIGFNPLHARIWRGK